MGSADRFKSRLQHELASVPGFTALVQNHTDGATSLNVALVDSIVTTPMPSSCGLSAWGVFTPCTKACNGGSKVRVRSVVQPSINGGACEQSLKQTKKCNMQPCVKRPCLMGQWELFSDCSKSCGSGTQSRTRRVILEPQHGGTECPSRKETRICNTQPCQLMSSNPQTEVVALDNNN